MIKLFHINNLSYGRLVTGTTVLGVRCLQNLCLTAGVPSRPSHFAVLVRLDDNSLFIFRTHWERWTIQDSVQMYPRSFGGIWSWHLVTSITQCPVSSQKFNLTLNPVSSKCVKGRSRFWIRNQIPVTWSSEMTIEMSNRCWWNRGNLSALQCGSTKHLVLYTRWGCTTCANEINCVQVCTSITPLRSYYSSSKRSSGIALQGPPTPTTPLTFRQHGRRTKEPKQPWSQGYWLSRTGMRIQYQHNHIATGLHVTAFIES